MKKCTILSIIVYLVVIIGNAVTYTDNISKYNLNVDEISVLDWAFYLVVPDSALGFVLFCFAVGGIIHLTFTLIYKIRKQNGKEITQKRDVSNT